MVYFIRARTHYQYAKSLLEELFFKKKDPNFNHLKDIFLQGLKALYAIAEINPQEKALTIEEILAKVLPTLRDEERQKVLYLKEIFFSIKEEERETYNLGKLLEEVRDFLKLVEKCLQPIL